MTRVSRETWGSADNGYTCQVHPGPRLALLPFLATGPSPFSGGALPRLHARISTLVTKSVTTCDRPSCLSTTRTTLPRKSTVIRALRISTNVRSPLAGVAQAICARSSRSVDRAAGRMGGMVARGFPAVKQKFPSGHQGTLEYRTYQVRRRNILRLIFWR